MHELESETTERQLSRFAEYVVRPASKSLLTISPLEVVAASLTIAALVWLNDTTTRDHIPFLVPPLAASIASLYLQPRMTMARSWNVIAGQFLGACAGFIAGALFPHHLPLAAGLSMCLGLVLQRLAHAYHPPVCRRL